MKHQVYGGSNFPFVTPIQTPVVRWIIYAAILAPIAIVLSGLAAFVWWII